MRLRYGTGRYWPFYFAGLVLLMIAGYFVFIAYF